MDLFINHKKHVYLQEMSLRQLLQELELQNKSGLAIAVNSVVVPKTDWESYALKHEDKLTIIRATQGG